MQREENPLINYGLFLPSENVRLGCSASLFCIPIRAEVFLSVCIASSQCSVEYFDGLPQVCNSPSNTSTACRRFATARRTLRQLVAGLQQPVEHFDSLSRICNGPSNTSTACRGFVTARRTLRQLVAGPASIPQLLIVRSFVVLSVDPAREISVQSLHYD